MIKRIAKRIIKWLATTNKLSFPRKIVSRIITNAIGYKYRIILYYNDSERARVFDLIRQIRKETKMLINDIEAYQVFMAVKRTEKIKGDIVEVGVYKGGSAKLICEAKGDRALHLFDSFEGPPELCEEDNAYQFHKGQFTASFEDVKNCLKKYPEVFFIKVYSLQ